MAREMVSTQGRRWIIEGEECNGGTKYNVRRSSNAWLNIRSNKLRRFRVEYYFPGRENSQILYGGTKRHEEGTPFMSGKKQKQFNFKSRGGYGNVRKCQRKGGTEKTKKGHIL